MIKLILSTVVLCSSLLVSSVWAKTDTSAENTEPKATIKNLDQLLAQVRLDQENEKQLLRQREQRFLEDKLSQQRLLKEAKATFLAAQKRSNPLLAITEKQQQEVDALRLELKQQSTALGDIHSIYNEFSSDFTARMQDSLVQAQLSSRAEEIAQLQRQSEDQLPSIATMQNMWLLIQQEMTEAGKNTWFTAPVINANGQAEVKQVLRLGSFTAFSDDQLLRYVPQTSELLALQKQAPEASLMHGVNPQTDFHTVVIDPSRGELLAVLGQAPGLYERILQGREVGFVIIGLAVVGLLLALYRGLYLFSVWLKTRAQLKQLALPQANNPLGRIFLQVKDLDVSNEEDEQLLQLTLDEAILKEIPALERGHSLIKLFAAIAPLLGLLGTVIGMIATFQSISLFGSGDPKLMASGISQALVTTVLGLVAAIPLLLSHNILLSFSRVLLHILDEQSAGLLAQDKEQKQQHD